MKKSVFILVIFFPVLIYGQQLRLPEDGFVKGWMRHEQSRHFIKSNLFDYINGGADLFLEFGFEELTLQYYRNDQSEIGLEAYRMENAEAALGIYLMKKGKETPHPDVPARNSADRLQFTILKNNYFILVNNFDGKESLIPVMVVLAGKILAAIPEGTATGMLSVLPRKNLVEGSELLVRGPVSLQPIFTFGDGDILRMEGDVFGVVGDYKDRDGTAFTMIVIPYPDEEAAEAAYNHLIGNLDSYLKIVKKDETGFSFKDYKSEFGLVRRERNTLTIKIHLPESFIKTAATHIFKEFSLIGGVFYLRRADLTTKSSLQPIRRSSLQPHMLLPRLCSDLDS
ncbi:MAG: hypothetical protein JXB23_11500 [Candidatus Aminicenantes bacterium]|nr:hypothetical protein [Candidatus Aminicenantes bacterium]